MEADSKITACQQSWIVIWFQPKCFDCEMCPLAARDTSVNNLLVVGFFWSLSRNQNMQIRHAFVPLFLILLQGFEQNAEIFVFGPRCAANNHQIFVFVPNNINFIEHFLSVDLDVESPTRPIVQSYSVDSPFLLQIFLHIV